MWIVFTILVLLLVYIYMICPALRKHPDSKLCKELYIAHRGLHFNEQRIPENSLPAFKNAFDNGYAVEIDLHLTKDGKVVIFHDDTLKRVCGVEGTVEQMTYGQLSEYRLFDTEEKIPLLEELLDICDEKSIVVIEFKCDTKNYRALCESANEILRKYNVKYIVQSFNPLAIMWYKKNRKDICRGQLASNFFKSKSKSFIEIICGYLLLNFLSRPDFISYDIKYPNTLPRKLCIAMGAMSAGWTIRNEEELLKAKKHNSIYIFENFMPNKKDGF